MAITIKSNINRDEVHRFQGMFEYIGSRADFKSEDIILECLEAYSPAFTGLELIRTDCDSITGEVYNVYKLHEDYYIAQ